MLYDQERASFLALDPNTPVVRYLEGSIDDSRIAQPEQFQLLLASASPTELESVENHHDTIQSLIQIADDERIWTVTQETHLTGRRLVACLNQHRPHIVHFTGHGMWDEAQQLGFLALENDDGSAAWIDSTALSTLLRSRNVQLVVLMACEGGQSGTSRWAGLAQALVQYGIPAVIAMSAPLSTQGAELFTENFYRALAAGDSLDQATAAGRQALLLQPGAEWAVPALFSRISDAQLWHAADAEPAHPSHTQAIPTQVTSPPRRDAADPQPEQPGQLAPPRPVPLPVVDGFVGRVAELEFYEQQLREGQIAVIAGMSGVGKTALGAALAQRVCVPAKIFWHTFQPDSGLDVVIWKLAAFLAWRAQPELWRMLQGISANDGKLPPLEILIDYVVQMVSGRGFLLCFDNFEYVEHAPVMDALVESLGRQVRAGHLSLIVVSGSRPDFVREADFAPLSGLSLDDARLLIEHLELNLPPTLLEQLHELVEGNVELLIMAGDVLRHANGTDAALDRLVRADNIQQYLLDELDNTLSDGERDVESATAVLGHPSTRDAIETTLDRTELDQTIKGLCDRFLLRHHEHESLRVYDQHSILRIFYYEHPSRQRRLEMHRRAGEHYLRIEPDAYRAAWHFTRAGDVEQAAMLLANDTAQFINAGAASAVVGLLLELDGHELSPLLAARCHVARAKLQTFLGEVEAAQVAYETALERLATVIDVAAARSVTVQAYLGLGELQRYAEPRSAIAWLLRARDAAAQEPDDLRAEVEIQLGMAQINTGEFDDALTALETGLALLSPKAKSLRATALLNIGNVHGYRGDLEASTAYARQALAIAQEMYDYNRMVAILQNLGVDQAYAGDWDAAMTSTQQARELALQIGDVRRRATIELTLGNVNMWRGNDIVARMHLDECLALTEHHAMRKQSIWAHTSLADLFLRQGSATEAAPHLDAALDVAQAIDANSELPEIQRHQAELLLLEGDFAAANAAATASLAGARDLGMTLEEGMTLRVLGTAQTRMGANADAAASFAASVALLDERSPYDAARTRLAWARMLLATGATAEAETQLVRAHAWLHKLGAQREMNELLHLLT
ncbi:MAG: CHAT domain-containing protein [Caldilineaceae bacterium]|nr:CHAT domain-containing protein [Caldilineaceae bacterium]